MRRVVVLVLVAVAALLAEVPKAMAQEVPPTEALRVFLDCQDLHCDFDYVRREITWVNWVRDRNVADVHVLGTQQHTGSGGRSVAFVFIGLGRYAGREDTLRFNLGASATDTERRDGIVRVLGLGLAPFAAHTPAGTDLSVTYAGGETPRNGAVHDKWNYWVFRTSVNGSINGESQQRGYSISADVTANRVTDALKVQLEAFGRYSHDSYDVTDPDTTYVNNQKRASLDAEAVWSVSDHWSLGGEGTLGESSFRNQNLSLELGPAVEYNVYPYRQSSRRSITFKYAVGVAAYKYADTTIFDRTSEIHPAQTLDIGASFDQPWGSIFADVSAFQYLNDLSKHHIDLYGEIDLRIFRGFSLNLRGHFSRIKDQIYLAKGALSEADVLLERRQLGTDYRYDARIGFSYTFGSIYNSVVNPRF